MGQVAEDISRRNVSLDEGTFVRAKSKSDSIAGRVEVYQNRDSSGRGCGHFRGNYCCNRSWGACSSYSNTSGAANQKDLWV